MDIQILSIERHLEGCLMANSIFQAKQRTILALGADQLYYMLRDITSTFLKRATISTNQVLLPPITWRGRFRN